MKPLYWITAPLYVIDQLSKLWVLKNFPDPTMTVPSEWRIIHVIPGFFDLVRVHNTGMAFGGFSGAKYEYANLIFCTIAAIALIAIVVMWRKNAFVTGSSRLSAALLASGILGNLTDRILHRYVVDFLSFDLKFMIWPSFNVADACICIAAGILVYSAIFHPVEQSPAAK